MGGLLWEIDQRFGSSFHEEVAASLPTLLAAASAGQAEGGAAASTHHPASPEEAGQALLAAAQDRLVLLGRAYNVINGLATDVDACLHELDTGAGGGGRPTPLPFPQLTPLHTTHTYEAPTGQQQAGSLASLLLLQEESMAAGQASAAPQGSDSPAVLPGSCQAAMAAPVGDVMLQAAEAAGCSSSSSSGGSMTPAAPAESPARTPAVPAAALSPTTARFVGAAFLARDAEVAEQAARPKAVLDTSLKDAAAETSRWGGRVNRGKEEGCVGRTHILAAAAAKGCTMSVPTCCRMAAVRRQLENEVAGTAGAARSGAAGAWPASLAALFESAAAPPPAMPTVSGHNEGGRAAAVEPPSAEATEEHGSAMAGMVPQVSTLPGRQDASSQAAQGGSCNAQQAAVRGAPALQWPGSSIAQTVDAHTAALAQVLTSLATGSAGAVTTPSAAALPPPAVRGPSQQHEVSPVPQSDHDASSDLQASRAPLSAPSASFLQHVLAGARSRSVDSSPSVPAQQPAAAEQAVPTAFAADSCRSSARTTIQISVDAESTGGPSYGAAVEAAAQVAREIDALLQQHPTSDLAGRVASGLSSTEAVAADLPAEAAVGAGPSGEQLLPSSPAHEVQTSAGMAAADVLGPGGVDAMLAELELGLAGALAKQQVGLQQQTCRHEHQQQQQKSQPPLQPQQQEQEQQQPPVEKALNLEVQHGQVQEEHQSAGQLQVAGQWHSDAHEPGSKLAEPHETADGGSCIGESSGQDAIAHAQAPEPCLGLLALSSSRQAASQSLALPAAGGNGRALQPRQLQRLAAAHGQHDSVGSLRLTADGASSDEAPGSAAGYSSPVTAAGREPAAALGAEVAQQLLAGAHARLQQEAAAQQAAATAAEELAAAAEGEVHNLEAQGRFVEAAAAAVEADRLVWQRRGKVMLPGCPHQRTFYTSNSILNPSGSSFCFLTVPQAGSRHRPCTAGSCCFCLAARANGGGCRSCRKGGSSSTQL